MTEIVNKAKEYAPKEGSDFVADKRFNKSSRNTKIITDETVNIRASNTSAVNQVDTKRRGMASVENTLNSMTGDIEYDDLLKVQGISIMALRAKANSSDISIFQKKDYAASLMKDGELSISYHNLDLLQRFVSETGRIVPSRISTIDRVKQLQIKRAIKLARFLGLLPYVEY
jgi:small subunit ribosomal protein S18